MDSVTKRKRALINAAYFILILGLFYLFMTYAFWLFFPFILAFFIAMAIQKPVNFFVDKTPLKKGFVSVLFVLLIVAVMGFLLSVLGIKIVAELKGFFAYVGKLTEDFPTFVVNVRDAIIHRIDFLPDRIESSVAESISDFSERLLNSSSDTGGAGSVSGAFPSGFDFGILTAPLNGVWSTAKQIPSVIIAIVIGIIACCFMTSDYDRIAGFIKRQISPKKRRDLSEAKTILFSSLGKMTKSYVTIICITFAEMLLGMNVLRLIGVYTGGYIVPLSIVVALIDIVPVLGTGTVLVPWALYSFIIGDNGFGFGLAVIYIVISVIRQIIEPKLVAANLGLPSVVVIMGMYIGLRLFRFVGLFIVPIVIVMVKLLNDKGIVSLWKTAAQDEPEEPSAELPASGDSTPKHEPKHQ
ncbi:MAG: AI-2E family transporter [Clostridiales bacterium]|nr:AI-2E family transporter [Clostridiales bacterium]